MPVVNTENSPAIARCVALSQQLNKAAVRLMRRGAGLEPGAPAETQIGDALDGFIGTWSQSDEEELLQATQVFGQVDERFWS